MVINHNCKCPYFHADVNECNANNGGCEHTCENVDGSFQCGCDTGYMLDADGLTCDGKCLYQGYVCAYGLKTDVRCSRLKLKFLTLV